MKPSTPVELCATGAGAGGFLFAGFVMGVMGIVVTVLAVKHFQHDVAVAIFPGIFAVSGIMIFIYGICRAADRSVKITLGDDGLTDHRTGRFIPWREVRGLRIQTMTYSNNLGSGDAILYVRLEEGDVKVNIFGLDRKPSQILNLVEDRIAATREEAAAGPEAVLAAVLAGITADLKGGIPITFAVAKLVRGGLPVETARQLVAAAAGESRAECTTCKLEYLADVGRCSGCGGSLVAVASASDDAEDARY